MGISPGAQSEHLQPGSDSLQEPRSGFQLPAEQLSHLLSKPCTLNISAITLHQQ